MKIRIVIDKSFEEDEVVIKCRELNEKYQGASEDDKLYFGRTEDGILQKTDRITLCRFDSILFLKPLAKELRRIIHKPMFFKIMHKLYELEEILPVSS